MNGAFVLLGSVLVVLLDQDEDHGVCDQHGLHGYKRLVPVPGETNEYALDVKQCVVWSLSMLRDGPYS